MAIKNKKAVGEPAKRIHIIVVLLTISCLLFNGCGTVNLDSRPEVPRVPPQLMMPEVEDAAEPEASFINEAGESGDIDIDNISEGYILARCLSNRQAVLSITKDDETRYEHLSSDGSWCAYPLTMGDGEYTTEIRLNAEGLEYEFNLHYVFVAEIAVTNELFLIPNHVVPYDMDSAVVGIAQQFYRESWNNKDMADDVFRWMRINLVYDEDLSQEMDGAEVIYVPNNDRFLELGKGICLDYAAFFASIMRSVGIPCKLVYGNVNLGAEGVKFHAWNHVWLVDEDGNGAWWRYDSTLGYNPYQLDSGKMEPVIYQGESIYGEPMRIY